ncbi:MAG: PAS domain S-box protein, partial [Verrucomicrobiaceae bacterium]
MNDPGHSPPPPDLETEVAGLRARLAEAEDALRAIRMGEVDALVGDVGGNSQLFVLQSADVESNRFHGEILSKVNDAVIAFDLEGHITYLNLAAESQYGVTASKVLGCHLESVCEIRWETPESEIEANRAMEQDGWWQGENLHVRKDGTVLHVESSATRFSDPDGTPAGYLHVVRDISQRREAETALRDSEARYRALFNSIDEGFCIIRMIFDRGGNPVDYLFLHVSPSFEAQTGLKDVVGKTMKGIYPGHEAFWFQTYGKVARDGVPVRFQHEAAELDRCFDVYASRFGEPADHEVAIIFNDITFRMVA